MNRFAESTIYINSRTVNVTSTDSVDEDVVSIGTIQLASLAAFMH